MLSVFALQLDIHWHDKPANHLAVNAMLDRVRVEPGALVVLPEMFDVGFTMHVDVADDEKHGMTRDFLSTLAVRLGSTVIAGLVTRDWQGKPANQALVIGPDGNEVGRYAKCQPFTPSGEHEKYDRGTGPVVFDVGGIKIAPLICYDLRFPELFRAATKLGAEVLVVIANWPSARIGHWTTLAQARAIENLAAVVAVNRCGNDPTFTYPGKSIIVDPKGVVLAEADDRQQVLKAEIDVALIRDWRRDFPALRDAGMA